MDPVTVLLIVLVALIALVLAGLHIGIVLGMVSLFGTYLMFDSYPIALELANQAAYGVLRNSIFAAIPLFVLMGEFISKSGMAADLYKVTNYFLKRIPGRLAVATVFGNAIFAAVTGVSIASAMAFSRIAYPEMQKRGYSRSFSLGSIAGSASLGMLIPPSVLLIVWGITIEESIGKLFLAGFIPGIILAILMAAYCTITAAVRPDIAPLGDEDVDYRPGTQELISGFGIIGLILLVLGGMFAGLFAPSESAAVGCAGAIVLALIKGLKWQDFKSAIIESGKTIAPILFLLLSAAMYAKLLALGGVVFIIQDAINGFGLSPIAVTLLMVLIWLVMGMLIDSISIILLTVPIFWPLAEAIGWNPYAFAIFGILAIEAGLLTPPFGLLVYTVKGAVADKSVTLGEIFKGSVPYWLLMLVVMLIIWVFPFTASFLPNL